MVDGRKQGAQSGQKRSTYDELVGTPNGNTAYSNRPEQPRLTHIVISNALASCT
jgi:hypothetical protein